LYLANLEIGIIGAQPLRRKILFLDVTKTAW